MVFVGVSGDFFSSSIGSDVVFPVVARSYVSFEASTFFIVIGSPEVFFAFAFGADFEFYFLGGI